MESGGRPVDNGYQLSNSIFYTYMMPKIFRAVRRMSRCIGLVCLLLPPHLLAEETANTMVIVADSRHLTGLTAWWVNVYNESHFYFALLTIVTIPLGGIILGSLADLLMRQIGIDLKSRALEEN
jgi:hypothetical protein